MDRNFAEYTKAQTLILNRLHGLPKENSLEGFIFFMMTRDINNPLLDIDKQIRYDKESKKYALSIEEAERLNSGEFENWIKNAYFGFSDDLKEFFLNCVGHNDFNLLDTFYMAIHFLMKEDDKFAFNEGLVTSNLLDRSYCLSVIRKYKNELIAELEWRIKRINPNNHYSYYPNNAEIVGYYNAIYLKGFKLLNHARFVENTKAVYDLLTVKLIHPATSIETFAKLFSGNSELFVEKVVWTGGINELNYFLKGIKQKLTTGKIYVIANRLFVNENGKEFGSETIKNNRDTPNSYDYLDKILCLF
ncbi:MAG: hypothetical protein KDC81_11725 [Flavobacteriaceae bacterium]|nr:hypothetical protein [Flavobacteriaceae bacterium]